MRSCPGGLRQPLLQRVRARARRGEHSAPSRRPRRLQLRPSHATGPHVPPAAAPQDGLTYVNGCVAKCQGAAAAGALARKQQQQTQQALRPVSAELMARHAAEGFRFLDFARVRRIAPSAPPASGLAAVR